MQSLKSERDKKKNNEQFVKEVTPKAESLLQYGKKPLSSAV